MKRDMDLVREPFELAVESRLGESGQNDKWHFCLTASMIGAHQERL